MTEKRASLEMIAPSVEEAVARGLEELGLPEGAVDVEVLDPGSRGLFGLGSRQARVRLTIKRPAAKTSLDVPPPAAPQAVEKPVAQPIAPVEATEPAIAEPQVISLPPVQAAQPAPQVQAEAPQRDELTLQVAGDTVRELLDKMKVRANVTAHYGEADDAHSHAPVLVEVRGNDLSILIGPRAETLNALQYIASLIVGKELGHSIPLVVDVEGFRNRREQQIRQLARRMAEQAVKTGRRQVLEPMPASERRLIHIELRNNPDVTTESIGEDPRRKVTIIPKNG